MTITKDGSIDSNGQGVMVDNGTNNTTIVNNGTISGNVNGIKTDAGKIDSITNSGTIKGKNYYGIYINVGGTVNNINNSGTIMGKEGIRVDSNSQIKTITNSGTIKGNNSDAISLDSGSTIESLTNSGTIIGGGNGVFNSGSTIESLTNQGTIYGSVSGVKNLGHINLIDNSGTIQGKDYYGIYANSGTIQSIHNQENGLIIGKQSGIRVEQGAKVSTISNSGTIQGKNGDGIYIKITTVDNINNSGAIIGGIIVNGGKIDTIENKSNGIINGGEYGIGLGFLNKNYASGTLIKNEGTINSTDSGIYLDAGTTVDTIDNSGLIQQGKYGIQLYDLGWGTNASIHVKTINNSGTIIAKDSGITFRDGRTNDNLSAMTIDNINNTGTIQAGKYGIILSDTRNAYQIGKINLDGLVYGGVAGFYIGANQKLTEDITVKGTLSGGTAGIINKGIIGTENDPSKGGIKLQGGLISASNSLLRDDIINPAILNAGNGIIYGNTELDSNSKIVGGIVNTDKGKLQGDILVKGGSSISGGIINTGSGVVTGSIKIEGSNSAIEGGIINDGEGKLEGSIEVSNGGKLDNIVNQGSGAIGGDIKVEGGGKVDNIVNNGNGQINGGINVGEGSSVGGITNSGNGNISGDIKNDGDLGTINNSGSISGSIENNNGDLNIKNDGDLGGSITIGDKGGNTSISNGSNGNIGGGIINNGDGNIDVDNKGTVHPDKDGNHIVNNGNGNINVGDWLTKPNEDGGFDGAINVGGNGSGSINIDNITVDTSDPNYDATKPINPNDIVNNNGNGGNVGVGNINSNNDLLNLVYDPISDTYKTLADVSAGVGSVMAQTLINTYIMRSFFIDTVMDDASRMAYKQARIYNTHKNNKDLVGFDIDNSYTGFILPYFSSNSIKLLGTSDYSKGHTKGMVAGFHTLRDIGMLGAYVGTEEANMDTKDYFSLKMQTVYAGLKYSNFLLEDEMKEVFIKTHTKVAYTKNDVQKFIDKGKKEANGNTDTYGYGASIGTGMNFYLNGVDGVITPEVSFNYEGGFTKAFNMYGEAALSHERYYESKLNLFSSTASIKWFNQWHPQISTSFEAGARINFNPEVDSRVNFANLKASETLDLPRTYQYVGASLIFSLAKDLDMSFNYNGIFANNSHSHTGYLQFDFIF